MPPRSTTVDGPAQDAARAGSTADRRPALALTWSDGAALLAVLLWGANFPITKQLMTLVEPLTLMFIRNVLASLLFAAILLLTGQWRLPGRKDWPSLLAAALIGMSLNQVFYSYGLHLTTASHSGLIFTLTPLFVFGVSHLLGHLRVSHTDAIGLALGLVGAGLIVGAPALLTGESGGASVAGDLLTVGAAVTWGLWTLLATPLLRRHGTLRSTAWITMVGGAGLAPLAVPGLLSQDWGHLPAVAFGGFAYSACLAGAGGALLWYGAVRRIGAARTTVYANMESFFAVLFAALLLAERVEWTALVGGGAVVAGVLLTRRAASG